MEGFTKYLIANNNLLTRNDREEKAMDFMKTRDGMDGFIAGLVVFVSLIAVDFLVYWLAFWNNTPISFLKLVGVELLVVSVVLCFLLAGRYCWGWAKDKE